MGGHADASDIAVETTSVPGANTPTASAPIGRTSTIRLGKARLSVVAVAGAVALAALGLGELVSVNGGGLAGSDPSVPPAMATPGAVPFGSGGLAAPPAGSALVPDTPALSPTVQEPPASQVTEPSGATTRNPPSSTSTAHSGPRASSAPSGGKAAESPSRTPTEASPPKEAAVSAGSPPPASFPGDSNTGVPSGTSLVSVPESAKSGTGWRWDGSQVVVTKSNVTISGLDVHGGLTAAGRSGVIVKESRVRCTGVDDWCVTLGTGSVLTDSEIGGGEDGTTFQPSIGVLSGSYKTGQALNTVQRVNIHHTVHGMRVDGDTTVVDSYLHDFPMGQKGWETAHTDGIMCTAGANVTIRHNTLMTGNTSPFFVQWQSGNVKISNYLIEDNYIVGVSQNNQLSSYGVDFENKGIASAPVIRNNTFAGNFQAGQILAPNGSTVTGNITTTGKAASIEYQ